MHIEHIALWTNNLEGMREFYMRWFGASSNAKYSNPAKGFESYFLTFETGARLELMHWPDLHPRVGDVQSTVGWVHVAISVGSRERVEGLTEAMRAAGVIVSGEPRQTGDGYYESTVLDPDGNIIEITV
jgi:lactoylglutathione lyase